MTIEDDIRAAETQLGLRILLINPARINAEGEWEAWDFATWYPGAYRYRSFDDLVAALADG